jgi:hypothetical protein
MERMSRHISIDRDGIRDDWGTRKALGYLAGEKLLTYMRAADSDPSWEANVPKFAAEIRQIFTRTSQCPRVAAEKACFRNRCTR